LIRSLGRQVVVVPDQDRAGLGLIDRAVELGWSVSIPNWQDCKDTNDAVQRYGRLATLLSILENAESSRIKIELRKKALVKRLQH
jgi:DNA primase